MEYEYTHRIYLVVLSINWKGNFLVHFYNVPFWRGPFMPVTWSSGALARLMSNRLPKLLIVLQVHVWINFMETMARIQVKCIHSCLLVTLSVKQRRLIYALSWFLWIVLKRYACLDPYQEENLKMKRLKEQFGEPLHWSDYLSLPFTQSVIH